MSTDRIEVYRTTVRRKWRWRYVAANGNILADSGQGYSRRIDCMKGAQRVIGGDWFRVKGRLLVSPGGREAWLPEGYDAGGAYALIPKQGAHPTQVVIL